VGKSVEAQRVSLGYFVGPSATVSLVRASSKTTTNTNFSYTGSYYEALTSTSVGFHGAVQLSRSSSLVLDGAIGTGVLNELAPHSMKGLAYWENGWRAFTNNKRPVNKPEDLKGLKIRSTPNPYHIQAFKLLGMNPSPMPIAELYTALETGTFDAQEHPINVTWSSKFYEVQKHLTVSNHVYSPLIVSMNKGKFDALPANYQTVVVEAAREAAKYQRSLNAANAGKVVADLKKSGMQVIENVDMAPFQKIVSAEIAKTFGEKNGPALLQAIENTK
jgi:TRAP-type C4-dicarboxylate transport system substrate-binding protein